jgi:hypothetical protein
VTVIPGPRPPKGHDRPSGGHDRGRAAHLAPAPPIPEDDARAPVSLVRTPRGWSVVVPAGSLPAGDLLEGMSLADLVAEEYGGTLEPDRSTRRSARGTGGDAVDADPSATRIAALERTVAQLEHALAARVATERAIGVLAERHGTSPRSAFEGLRREARSQGRPVQDLAREVLDGLSECPDPVVLTVALAPQQDDTGRTAEGRR